MGRNLCLAAVLLALTSCGSSSRIPTVMARHVPERSDDFVWENNYVCYRAYGKALEGNPTSPGLDVWVKTPGGLVADQRYRDELENGRTYHKDWGNGKDCYKVGVSLGAGASAPLVGGKLVYPATNYRSYEIVSSRPDRVVFVLNYPEWEVDGHSVALERTITVSADTYFCKSEDRYTGDFESLTIAAGIYTHEVEEDFIGEGRLAVWEKASDTTFEPEDGMLGIAVVMPDAEAVIPVRANVPHLVATRTIRPGESVTYLFGSCWSKCDIKTAGDWFSLVAGTEL